MAPFKQLSKVCLFTLKMEAGAIRDFVFRRWSYVIYIFLHMTQ